MSITMLTELCGDCVDRYRAQRFDELTALLKHILRELDDASKGGEGPYAAALGHLRSRIEGLVEEFAPTIS